MKLTFSILSTLLLLASCQMSTVQGSEELITKTYDYTDFTAINTSSAISVEVIQSKNYSVELECNKNIEEFISVELNGDELEISVNSNRSLTDVTMKVKIHAPHISMVEASGASSVHFKKYKFENLTLNLSGASEVSGSVKIGRQLSIESSGASSVGFSGSANNVQLDYSGASSFSGKDLTISHELIIESSGASSIEATANGTIDIDASGASHVSYYGKGKVTSNKTSSAASVSHK